MLQQGGQPDWLAALRFAAGESKTSTAGKRPTPPAWQSLASRIVDRQQVCHVRACDNHLRRNAAIAGFRASHRLAGSDSAPRRNTVTRQEYWPSVDWLRGLAGFFKAGQA